VWHVDDLKISHVSKDVVEDIIARLNKKFGKESPLTTNRGKVLEYLGLTLDYSKKGTVKISMYEYVKKIVDESLDDMGGIAKTLASSHLFLTNPECRKLPEKTAQLFHRITAKLLYLCKRTRQDIQTAVAFLCTRVKSPDTARYTNSSGFSVHKSEKSGHRRLQKTNACYTVPEKYTRADTYNRAKRPPKLVGRQLICSTSGYAESQWHHHDAWEGFSI